MELLAIYEEIAGWVWVEVHKWSRLDQDTLGKQLRRAVDSINANLVEGDGRYSDKEAIHHFYIARGSAREARLHLRRAEQRGLVDSAEAASNLDKLASATRLLNLLIRYRRSSLQVVREPSPNEDPFLVEI